MRRNNRRNNAKKERIIMVVSSAFVLTALTLTGIYMKSDNVQQQDDGYTIDFTALENNLEDKFQEIAQNEQIWDYPGIENNPDMGDGLIDDFVSFPEDGNELDSPPVEAGSGLVEIPGLTDGENLSGTAALPEDIVLPQVTKATPEPSKPEPETKPAPKAEEEKKAPTAGAAVAKTLHFEEKNGLLRPVNGMTLIPYSMDSSIYFSTLDHYKYNPAMMLAVDAGTPVAACAEGKVVDIFQDAEIGQAVTMELGDGYRLTYGQLENIKVKLNSYVDEGDTIGSVAAPTKYYCLEGSNLYLALTMNGEPVNPEPLFRQ